MNQMTQMAVRLARKGASDDVIAMVLEMMSERSATPPHEAAPSVAPAPPTTRAVKRVGSGRKDRAYHYAELLAAIRRKVVASGPVEASARDLCVQNRDEWMQARRSLKSGAARESAHGLAGVITHARWSSGGVVGNVRFTFLRFDHEKSNSRRGGNGTAIYRVEAV